MPCITIEELRAKNAIVHWKFVPADYRNADRMYAVITDPAEIQRVDLATRDWVEMLRSDLEKARSSGADREMSPVVRALGEAMVATRLAEAEQHTRSQERPLCVAEAVAILGVPKWASTLISTPVK